MNAHFRQRDRCDVCGSSDKTILISRDFLDSSIWDFLDDYYDHAIDPEILKGSMYEIARCSQCGFMWQTQILKDEGMGLLYGKWIDAEHSLAKKTHAKPSMHPFYATEVNAIVSLFKKKAHEIVVLDYGMGWGYWCLMSKAFGYDTYGLELSEDRIAHARGNGIQVIDNSGLTPERFDFINTEQTFEHIPDPLETLKQLVISLKPDGVIKLSVPNAERVVGDFAKPGWKPAKNPFHPLEHINGFSHKSLLRLGKEAGLTLCRRPDLIGFTVTWKTLLRLTVLRGSYAFANPTCLYFRKPA